MEFLTKFKYDDFYLQTTSEQNRADVIEYARDPEVTKFLTFKTYRSSKDADYFFDEYLPKILSGKNTTSLAIYNNNDECLGLIDACAKGDSACEIGYVLKRQYWRQGYMSKVLPKMIEICFNELNNEKIFISHHFRNKASERLIQKAGFTYLHDAEVDLKNDGVIVVCKKYEMKKLTDN